MALTTRTYEEIALADPERKWEMHRGRLVEKLPMAIEHGDLIAELMFILRSQIDPRRYRLGVDHHRLRRSSGYVYIPDLVVVPIEAARNLLGSPLAIFDAPAALVVEVQSPSTEHIDFREKLPEYQARGDQEIWLVHPHDLAARVWVRQSDGRYSEASYGPDDTISLTSLPGVTVRLADLRMPEA